MKTTFETTDRDLAAYLLAAAYPLLGVWRAGRTVVYEFPANAALSAEAFYEGAFAPAKNVLQAARQLESVRRSERVEYAVV